MKKLLSLLSVLTIGGTAVPTTIAASPYQKEKTIKNSDINYQQTNNLEKLNRNKRTTLLGDEINNESDSYVIILTPKTFEEIVYKINTDNWQIIKDYFTQKNIVFNSAGYGTTIDIMKVIVKNWYSINSKWQESNRTKRIKITLKSQNSYGILSTGISNGFQYISTEILNSEGNFTNELINNLKKDYGIDSYYCYNCAFNLGIIDDDYDTTILQRIKMFHPNLDITQIEVVNKTNYSYFSKGFSAKIKVKNNSSKYSPGNIDHIFTFNTKININKINDIIKNDSKVIIWINHLQDWNNDVKQELKTSVVQKTAYEKIEWKNRKKEDLKTYIRDWDYILNLIEHELKLEELNNSIKDIKIEINNLKEKVINLQWKIDKLGKNNEKLEGCTKVGAVISASTGWIPVIGTLISTVYGTASALCDIANS